ncbi:hypothetical protein FA13DRAFT_1010686 [Coprinellus micaceus]|uniref:Uncharacterized protein n=1 Tax=Coprinellus micaceus TaxID=71717 RepID=A0A4Y7SY38_COPMI|nr:hypothetical protein FA13DRAFT_1010686 [Coprinellus micaceus]
MLNTLEKDDFDAKYEGAADGFSLRNHLEADLERCATKSERQRKGKRDNISGTVWKGHARLHLTGRVDYLLTHPPNADSDCSSKALPASSLDRVVPLMRPCTNILLIQAKRMDPKENIVSRNLPQVLAQAHLR